MKYIGLNRQIWNNNFKSVVLLILFPAVILGLVWLFIFFVQPDPGFRIDYANEKFLRTVPWVSIAVILWFTVAWFSHSKMIE
ncbi:MAG: protease, partial [Bacteroidales bacterium]